MMSLMRHEPEVRSYSVHHPPGTVVLPQPAGWDQLLLTASGVMRVEATTGTWVVPTGRAVWVPDGVDHRLVMRGPVRVRALYLRAGLASVSDRCRAVEVTPLLRELLLHAIERAPLHLAAERDAQLVGVLLDQLSASPDAPLQVPQLTDPRARDVAAILAADPASDATVDELARSVGASRRTIERCFRADTGMTVAMWRQRLRLVEALGLLAEGRSVTSVAAAVGYATPSAFGAMFRSELGTSPARYFGDGPRR